MSSASTRLIRLLNLGYYPVELPPPFQTKRFDHVRATFAPGQGYVGSTTFFDGATFRGGLRTFGVINPANYMLLSRFLAENWGNITRVFDLSTCSGARPKFPSLTAQGRAIDSTSLATKRRSQRHLASVYPVVVGLDINRFYGSIYTHSIPWAVLGKEEAKRQLHAKTLSRNWSDKLDILTRNCNQRQTVGIPIGPDTSRIISEILLSRIDNEISLSSSVHFSQMYHSIDDYKFGVFNVSDAEKSQSAFVKSISRYEFRLNDFKTSVDQGLEFSPSNFQRHFDVLDGKAGRSFVEHFFEILYDRIPAHRDENVLGYALKRFSKRLAHNRERELVREYLQRLLFALPHQARWILPILLGIYKARPSSSEARHFISWGIEISSRRNDVGSLLWYLYAAMFLEVKLGKESCSFCVAMSNELVDLMLYHGRHKALFSFPVTVLRKRYKDSDFSSPAWLPLYEIERHGWDTSTSFRKIGGADDHGGLYQHLRLNRVQFYSVDADAFDVSAFDGWNLTAADFGDEWIVPQPFVHAQADDWDDYGF